MVVWGRKLQLVNRNSLEHTQRQREKTGGGLGGKQAETPQQDRDSLQQCWGHRGTRAGELGSELGTEQGPGKGCAPRQGKVQAENTGKYQETELSPMALAACHASRL